MTVRAMKAGAVEFLTKPLDDDALLGAISHALDQSRAALGHEAEIRDVRERYESLSRREREVMSLVVSGLLNKQVGARSCSGFSEGRGSAIAIQCCKARKPYMDRHELDRMARHQERANGEPPTR